MLEPKNSWRTVLEAVALGMLLATLGSVLAYRWGMLDQLAIRKVRWLAQNESKEHNNTWYGVPVMQYPTDLLAYQELLTEVAPDFIIEAGTASGGLALYLATVLQHVNPEGRVLTIDIDPAPWAQTIARLRAGGPAELLERIRFFAGGSTTPEALAWIAEELRARPGARVLVLLDTVHTRAHVSRELELYAPLVTPGSYLLVNDTHFGDVTEGSRAESPAAAVREFLASHGSTFTVDTSRDRFFISCMPGGVLRRIAPGT